MRFLYCNTITCSSSKQNSVQLTQIYTYIHTCIHTCIYTYIGPLGAWAGGLYIVSLGIQGVKGTPRGTKGGEWIHAMGPIGKMPPACVTQPIRSTVFPTQV
ncbi:hypothetical protein CLU79DRAFT_767267 [Phycomyces nitens]|nr:hypothetical protein CLU79DRAFT_767267 [Phycomyces nitens]